jgi:glutaminyl-tRNA synthetase
MQRPTHPHPQTWASLQNQGKKEVWIERTDFEETPLKGFFVYSPATNKTEIQPRHQMHRLYQRCVEPQASSSPADTRHTKAVHPPDTVRSRRLITWVTVADALKPKCALYDRLFKAHQAGGAGLLAEPGAE